MAVYLILTSGNLVACLILVGWVKTVFPDDLLPLFEVLGIYLAYGPKRTKTLLLNPGYGIPILPPPQTAAEPVPVLAVETASKKETKNQLTLNRPQVINDPVCAEG
jgi:hypothetical protein